MKNSKNVNSKKNSQVLTETEIETYGLGFQQDFSVDKFQIDGEEPTLEQLYKGFSDTSDDDGGSVVALNGKLIIRPKFQRGYVVKENKRWQSKLLESVSLGYPIGHMYFGHNIATNDYCVVDGQQRLLTLFNFLEGKIKFKYENWLNNPSGNLVLFRQLPKEVQEKFLKYKPTINKCKGNERDLMNWFTIINQDTSLLNDQELRNCAFTGEWCEDAKRHFSKNSKTSKPNKINGFVFNKKDKDGRYYYDTFMYNRAAERQLVLETALDWASAIWAVESGENKWFKEHGEGELVGETYLKETPKLKAKRILAYMDKYHNYPDAEHLVKSYTTVIDWVRSIFDESTINSKITRLTDWGRIYALYGRKPLTIKEKKEINKSVDRLMQDPDVVALSRIVEYVLRGERKDDEKMLSIRNFTISQKDALFKEFGGIDPVDGKKHDSPRDFCCHHIVMWSLGGKTVPENLLITTKENHEKLLHGNKFTESNIKDAKKRLIECVKKGTPEKYVPLIKKSK